jgi:hypothetical protein
MADFPAQQLVAADWGYQAASAADVPAQQLLPADWGRSSGTAGGIGGGAALAYFLMRGEDSGAADTTWVATVNPDPNGAQATPGNTTPPLVGSIVAGSGAVLVTW